MSIDRNSYLKYIHAASELQKLSDPVKVEIDAAAQKIGLASLKITAQESYDAKTLDLAAKLADKYHIDPVPSHEDFQALLKAAKDFLVFKHDVMPFYIDPLPPLSLKTVENAPIAPYTMLTHNVYNSKELLSISEVFPKVPVRNLIVMKPERLVLHEMAKNIILDVSLNTDQSVDDQLSELSHPLTQEFLKKNPQFCNEMNNLRSKVEQEVFEALQNNRMPPHDYANLVEAYTKDAKDADKGISEETKNRAIAQRVAATVYQQTAKTTLKKYNIFSSTTLQSRNYNPLPKQTGATRHLYMVNGGQASGKGGAEKSIKTESERQGIDWESIAKLNTDSFKATLLQPKDVPEEFKLFYGGLTHDEASMIRESILVEYQERLAVDTAPHLYIDQVWPETRILEMGGKQPNGIDVVVVQLPVESSLRLGYKRGEKMGRYEPKVTILNGHKEVPIQLMNNLEAVNKQGPQNIRLRFVANTGPDTVQECAFIDFQRKTAEFKPAGRTHLEGFFKKTQLDKSAKTYEEIYPKGIAPEKIYEENHKRLETILRGAPKNQGRFTKMHGTTKVDQDDQNI